jgi:hypothetical protein
MQGQPGQKHETLSEKKTKPAKGLEHKALNSVPSTSKKKNISKSKMQAKMELR